MFYSKSRVTVAERPGAAPGVGVCAGRGAKAIADLASQGPGGGIRLRLLFIWALPLQSTYFPQPSSTYRLTAAITDWRTPTSSGANLPIIRNNSILPSYLPTPIRSADSSIPWKRLGKHA
ncbi:hypothetical protein B0T13DRAFT_491541 [Neurospora crassa]|nr:hypothetical protein B0T13DRAFT_492244 [Neurospora crassa]KAK3487252.1 hypothetical protein B0T13DRAFT_491541 [Neurospora crassa]